MDTNKRSLLHPRVSVLNAKNLTAPKTNNVLEQKNHLKTKLAIDTKNLSKKTKRTRLTKIASKSKIIKRGLFNLSTSRLREVIKSIDQEKKELEAELEKELSLREFQNQLIENKNKEIDNNRKDLEQMRIEIKRRESVVDIEKDKLLENEKRLKILLSNRISEIKILKNERTTLIENSEKIEDEKEKIVEKLENKEKESNLKNEEYEENFNKIERKLRSIKNELENERETNERLLSKIKKTTNEYEEKMAKIETDQRKVLRENVKLIENSKNEFESLNINFQKSKETINEKEKEIENLKMNLNDLEKILETARKEVLRKDIMLNNSGGEIKAKLALLSSKEFEIENLIMNNNKNNDLITELNRKIVKQDEIRKKLHNQVQELKGNIRVYCRVRPLVKTDKHFGKQNISFEFPEDSLNQKIVALTKKQNNLKSKKLKIVKREISFDRVFSPNDKQNVVFEEISQLVQSALDGYKVCIFAYGQTGSGKTFTMEGPENMNNKNDEGMIPRSVKKIFEHIREHKKNWEYKCEVSFLEIYNEEIRDLLTSENKNIQISLEDEYKPAKNAKYVKVTSESEIEPLLRTAKKNRSVGKTDVNEYSSRSHSIFQIILNGKNPETGFSVNGALVLVDLAGSERLKKSNSTGQRKEEAKFINSSLSMLSNVIECLNRKSNHIPFRNSKLTHLLQNCFGGDCKTLMFVNLSPDENEIGESINSLRFAEKANNCHIGTATRNIIKDK